MTAMRDVIDFAQLNGGVVTTHEAAAIGMNRMTLSRRVTDGVLVRIGNGVFALPGAASRPEVRLQAAQRLIGAVVSHESAACIHGFQPIPSHQPTVTVSHRGTHNIEDLIIHQSTDLAEAHTCRMGGLVVTTRTRTILDLSQTLSAGRLAKVIDNALASREVDLDRLVDMNESVARRGKPGIKKIRAILEGRSGAPLVSDSVLERRLIKLILDSGLPPPTTQFKASWLRPINGRVDLAYVDARLVIEGDGRRWHVLADAFETDRRRDNAAQLAGWRILRFTWRMIEFDPIGVVTTIRSALQL